MASPPALIPDSWFVAKQGYYIMFHAAGHFVHCSGWRFLAAENLFGVWVQYFSQLTASEYLQFQEQPMGLPASLHKKS
jgi:hypothetical protein